MTTTVTVRRGTIELPDELRDRFGIEDGTVLVAEASEAGILLRRTESEDADGFEIELYTPERRAEFLLSNVLTPEDYTWARREVAKMGIDPDTIPHRAPAS
jgi:bifunctional DNA-binding transcriptional regulator/antitoxin component of YhaV-PrlF toxin-antitoxin module